jgi:phenylalanyl-tRNA synthetase alpha chain
VFHQVEGLAVDEGITLADLTGTLDFLLKALFGQERRTEFRTHYFPFTEPSIEAYVSATSATAPAARCAATRAGSRSAAPGWSTRSSSSSSATTPSGYSGFAFGWGLERIAMLRHEFPDLRELWRNDLRFSRQF